MSSFTSPAWWVNGLITISGIWIPLTVLAAIPWVQRQLLYMHWLSLWWFTKPNIPESFGFVKGQVAPFYIRTEDDVELYSWLIAPIGFCNKHRAALQEETDKPPGNINRAQVFKYLIQSPDASLVIYFHGNAATLSQPRRTQEYRNMYSASPDNLFVLAFDYRGFGYSKGRPSEHGLILDAIAVISWALDVARIPPHRIVLHSHSLGTAVATAAAHHFALREPRVEFAGLVLCAPFSDAHAAFQGFGFSVGVSPLAPLRLIPALQAWFGRRLRDRWRSAERLAELVAACGSVRVHLLHSRRDGIMPWQHSERIFWDLVAAVEAGTGEEIHGLSSLDLGEAGTMEEWSDGKKTITKEILEYGDHDIIMLWSSVPQAIARMLRAKTLLVEGTGDL